MDLIKNYAGLSSGIAINASSPNNNSNQSNIKTKGYPSDTIELSSNKKEKTPTLAKWAAVAAGIGGAAATAFFLIRKNRFSELKQLAEHIEFKPAETIEDAIKFGKETFGIKSYNGFEKQDLEALNWVNEGLVKTSNTLKGKIRVPKWIQYTDKMSEDTLACVMSEGKYFGYLAINKNIFRNFDSTISEAIKELETSKILYLNADGSASHLIGLHPKASIEVCKLLKKFKAGEIKTLKEKLQLYGELRNIGTEASSIIQNPLNLIKQILNNPKAIQELKNNKAITTNIDEIKKLSTDKQVDLFQSMYKELKEKVGIFCLEHRKSSPFSTIAHEMGHLQDDVPRVAAKEVFDNPGLYPKALKEWLENEEYQKIASSVSLYAPSGPGEFIAEVVAGRIAGIKYSDKVMNLYKHLKGPIIPD